MENRARLLLDVMRAVVAAVGGGKVGVRLSPVTPANDIVDADPQALFAYVLRELAPMGLAFLHLIEGATGGPRDVEGRPFDYAEARRGYRDAGGTGAWMVNNGYDQPLAEGAVQDGADIVAFGRPYIANPDLVERLRAGAPLNTPDRTTFYGGGAKGYTDYPALA
jgi:N-ethylmaleimide reductase